MPILCSLISGFQKCRLFICMTINNAKNCISKCNVITFTCFFCHCTVKIIDIALKFFMRVVCNYIDHIYSAFLDNLKFLDFIDNFLKNWNFEFWGSKSKNIKNPRLPFLERSFLRRLAFSIAFYFKTEHSSSLQTFLFLPKMAKHNVTKTPFSQKFLNGCFWNFCGRREIDAWEGTETFVSVSDAVFELSRKTGRGWAESAPQVGRVSL